MSIKRGQVSYRNRASQIRDYSGIRYGDITPTDIDGFFEMSGRVFVFYELKTPDAPFLRGQRLAFERLCDLVAPPKESIFIIAEHETPISEDIRAHEAIVLEFRYKRRWYPEIRRRTIKELTDDFISYCNRQ